MTRLSRSRSAEEGERRMGGPAVGFGYGERATEG